MSINATVKVHNNDVKEALHQLHQVFAKESFKQPNAFFVKPSKKRYELQKKHKHLQKLKRLRKRLQRRKTRPIDPKPGEKQRAYLHWYFRDGVQFKGDKHEKYTGKSSKKRNKGLVNNKRMVPLSSNTGARKLPGDTGPNRD